MRRFLSILTLATFLLYVLNATLTWTAYGLFSKQIAEELCVNRDNPCCQGRCYITRSIREQEESKSLTPTVVLSPEKILVYIEPRSAMPLYVAPHNRLFPHHPDSALRAGCSSLLDPPPRRFS